MIDATLGGAVATARPWPTASASPSSSSASSSPSNQLQIAPAIVTGLFYALLAIIVGVTVIAIGGGGIGPMRSRWENALAKYDEEKPKMQEASKGAKDRIAERAQQRAEQAKPDGDGASPGAHRLPARPARSADTRRWPGRHPRRPASAIPLDH